MLLRHDLGFLVPVSCRAKLWVPSNDEPVIVVNNKVWNPFRERFEDIGDASYAEIFASLQINQLVGFGVGGDSALTPVTRTYNSGAATETAPSGTGFCVPRSQAGGGGGGCRLTVGGAGGGAGGYCEDTARAIVGLETCAYSVGAGGNGDSDTGVGGNGTSGGNSTINTGTGGFTGIAHAALGGGASPGVAPGTGGTASGGTAANTTGNSGDSAPDGLGGINILTPRGDGGVGGDTSGSPGGAGVAGQISFAYTA